MAGAELIAYEVRFLPEPASASPIALSLGGLALAALGRRRVRRARAGALRSQVAGRPGE